MARRSPLETRTNGEGTWILIAGETRYFVQVRSQRVDLHDVGVALAPFFDTILPGAHDWECDYPEDSE